MEYQEVKQLLERYWNAETDIAEEQQLKHYFKSAVNIPDDLVAEKYLFEALAGSDLQVVVPGELDKKLQSHLKQKPVAVWKTVLKYAAVVLPLIAVSYLIFLPADKTDQNPVATTVTSKEKALEEANAALSMLAANMKDGLTDAGQLQLFEDLGKQLEKTQTQKQ